MYAHIVDGLVAEVGMEEKSQFADAKSVKLDGRTDVAHVGMMYDEGKDEFYVPTPEHSEATLDELKDSALLIVEHEAKHARAKLYSDSERLAIYTAKYYDAKAYRLKVLGEGIENYVWINSEVLATGCSADEAASTFISNHADMLERMAEIEQHRIKARFAINTAINVEEIRAAKSEALKAMQ